MSPPRDRAPHPDRFAEILGIERLEAEDDVVRARIPVSERLFQPYGLVHGGVYSSLVEGLCSWTTDVRVKEEGLWATGQSLSISFIRPISSGHVNASARPRHRGRTTWVWDAEITDDEGRLCALAQMTVAVRPSRSSGS